MNSHTRFDAAVLAAGAAAMLMVAALMLLTWTVASDATQATQWVTHTHEVINSLTRVRADTLQVEYSTQSFRITGDPERLLERDGAIASREALLQQIRAQTVDNPAQQQRWAALRAVINERMQLSYQIEQLRKTQGAQVADAFVARAPLRETRSRTYGLLQAMGEEELRLLAQRSADQLRARERMVRLGWLDAATFLLLLVGGYLLLRRQMLQTRLSQQALAESEEGLATTLSSIGDAVLATDTEGRITRMNPVAEMLTGWSLADAKGRGVQEVFCIVDEDHRQPVEIPVQRVLQTGQVQTLANHTLLLARNGREWPIADSAAPIRNAAGHILGVVLVFRDESDARRYKHSIREQNTLLEQRVQERTVQLHTSEDHLHSVINSVPALIAYVDAQQRYVYVNLQYQQRFSPERANIIGCTVREILGEERYAVASPLITQALLGQAQSYDWQPFPGVWQLINYLPTRDAQEQVNGYYVLGTDISQIKTHEAELDHVANYDPLTHLPNRRLLSDRLKQSILRSDRSGKSSAICFLDLDGFKTINDQLGHSVGDLVLVGVARHLSGILRAEDTLARLGGDEFVVLLSEVASAEECTLILERMLEAARLPVDAGEHRVHISASVGVSLYPSDNADPDILLRHADMAMYLAKQAGKNRYQLFDPENDRAAQSHRANLVQMQTSLQQQEFVLFYQPKVDLVSGAVMGAEALIRWQHPTRGLLAPADFLPQLNGSPLESVFGDWVINAALTQMRSWLRQGLEVRVSVNISANHLLQPDFCERLGQALARYPDLAPSSLELEVLETAALADMQQAVEILERCMERGVRFSLDDFGTGYSSLTYLRKLPVHTLKIDQSFVRDMLVDPEDLGIVRGIIELAKVFHRQVVAEGVETLEHGARLRSMGCRVVQGYGIARPMPPGQFAAWCEEWLAAGAWRGL